MEGTITFQMTEQEATYLGSFVRIFLDKTEHEWPYDPETGEMSSYRVEGSISQIPSKMHRDVARKFVTETNKVIAHV